MRKQQPSTLHRHLHLQHHRHTGRVLEHRHTSFRGLAVVLVLSAVFIVGLNSLARVTADSIFVSARNPAPIPSTPAEITSPTDGTVVTTAQLTVSGNCPVITPRVIIAIVDNGTELGSVACDSSNEFTLPITLQYGEHSLIARTYTITEDTGPDSSPVHVSYPAPTVPTTPATTPAVQPNHPRVPPAAEDSTSAPLTLSSARPFIIYGPSKDAVWIGHINGGRPPYSLVIDWGDGHKDRRTVSGSTEQYLRHHYRTVQSYDILITVSDTAGHRLVWHTAAVTPYIPPVAPLISTGGSGFWHLQWIGIYGAYLLLLALFGYLWARSHPYVFAKVPIRTPIVVRKRKQNRR